MLLLLLMNGINISHIMTIECCKCYAIIYMECFTNVIGITGKLCNKHPKWQVVQNCSSSDSFNAISGFTSNSRAPGGPVTIASLVLDLPSKQRGHPAEFFLVKIFLVFSLKLISGVLLIPSFLFEYFQIVNFFYHFLFSYFSGFL